ncbi:HAD family hydrolase [Cryobacterium sp. TMS1-20-1]|uniref:HAD family hydrolase n=1 Tax=Cryobacterium sp. TMS1-20-1 TaxID=1259223 RepID=UPI00106B3BB7|nr:HAD hydrolase-like protein [Cryobacterium sp. TMS1-20-1]TFC70747.1 HAD family hydrolase [Cryobacterium sp. TMS1-20-1]
MNIVFDLDGTLLDSKARLYELFQHLVPSSLLSYKQYWELKGNKFTNQIILAERFAYDNEATAAFVKDWMQLIETPEFLALDSNFSGMHDALSRLREQADLYVCTARQDRAAALDQLERLGLLEYFGQVLVTEQRTTKETLIALHVEGRTDMDWMLGDTGKDVQAGKAMDMNTCAVLSGFMNASSLRAYKPDLILESATDFRLDE